jgi:hypothetical protein
MSSVTKKTSTAKKQANGKAKPARASSSKSLKQIDKGSDKRYVQRDETGRFVEKANEHMERAWGKIYARREKARKVA